MPDRNNLKKGRSKRLNGEASLDGTTATTSTKKKGGFSKIKRLLRGKTKKRDGGASSDSTTDVNSIYPIQDQQNQPPRGLSAMERDAAAVAALSESGLSASALDRGMAKIPEEDADVSFKENKDAAPKSSAKKQKPAPAAAAAPSLQVVLLLMDPTTRRFELLQLEFDSDKAKVSDILSQIPVSVTEEAIKKQQYRGVMDRDSAERGESARLSSFCKGKEVLVALPKGLSVEDCTKLARPILGDDKVINMLNASGVDTSAWRNYKEDANRARNLPTEATKGGRGRKNASSKRGPLRALLYVVVLALLGVSLKYAHDIISKPIQMGDKIQPGSWKSKCGLLGFLPFCENAFMQVDVDGTVKVFDSKQELMVQIQGFRGDTSEEDKSMVLGDDRILQIGGRPAHYASSYADQVELSPWPFAEAPRIKMQRTTGPNLREKIFTPV